MGGQRRARTTEPGKRSAMGRYPSVLTMSLLACAVIAAGVVFAGSGPVVGPPLDVTRLGSLRLQGVSPAKAASYDAALHPMFRCLDGSASLAFERVNDNYCDCADGSDEPGTPACPAGAFYCRNRAHEPKTLPSSRVHDGVCDCCDGSDEAGGGRAACPNTCREVGAIRRAQLSREAAAAAAGAAVRRQWVDAAPAKLAALVKEAEQLTSELGAAAADAASKDAVVKTLEAQLNAEYAAGDAARAAARAAEEALAVEPAPASAPAPVDTADTAGLPAVPASLDGSRDFSHHDSHGSPPPSPPDGESAEEMGRRIASRWTHDTAAAGGGEVGGVHPESHPHGGDALSDVDAMIHAGMGAAAGPTLDDLHDDPQDGDDNNNDGDAGNAPQPAPDADGGGGAGAEVGSAETPAAAPPPSAALTTARDVARAAHDAQSSLETRIAAAKASAALDLGPDGAYGGLLGTCLSVQVDKYTYEVCPFGKATQKEGGSETALGSYSGWEDDGSVMAFTGGHICWNGPQRSLRARMVCGTPASVRSLSEPNRCEYHAELVSPAACGPAHVERLQRASRDAEREAAAPHDDL